MKSYFIFYNFAHYHHNRVNSVIKKIYLLLLFTFIFSIGLGYAQLAKQDSLVRLLQGKTGRERVTILNQLGTLLRESDHSKTIQYSMEADSLASIIGDFSGQSRALENIGWIYYRQGNWQKSFEFSSKAYDLAIKVNDKLQAARLMNNMGALYYEQQNHQKSVEQFRKGYELATEVNDLQTRIRSLNNMALNFTQSGQQDSAMIYARKSISLNQEAGTPYLTSFAHRVIGDVYMALGNYDSAKAIFERSLEMAQTQGVKSFEAGILHRLGNAYLLNQELKKAEEVLTYSVSLCFENGYLDELSKSHKYLAQVFEKKGNISEAYYHLSKFQFFNDSLMNKSSRDRLALLQGMFEQNLQQSEFQLLKAQNENQLLRLESSRRYLIFFSVGIVLILGLLARMYFLNRKVAAKNADLENQKHQISQANEVLAKQSDELAAINVTKNKLFSILGHDLRGPIGQVKGVVDLLMQGHLNQDEFMGLLKVLQRDINSVNFTLNNILKWSMSQIEGFLYQPEEFNLKNVVDNSLKLLDPFFKEKNLTVFNQISSKVTAYADPDLIDVVIRNLLNNAMKFSNVGDAVTLLSEVEKDWVIFCVLDQGIGMKAEQLEQVLSENYSITKSTPGTHKEKGSGLGLQLVKEFVRKCGGEIHVESTPKHGTKFCIKLPSKPSHQPEAVV